MSALLSHNLEIQIIGCPDASPVCKILTSTHQMCKIYTAIRQFIQHSMANVASMESNTTNKQTAINAFITNRLCCLSKLLTIPIYTILTQTFKSTHESFMSLHPSSHRDSLELQYGAVTIIVTKPKLITQNQISPKILAPKLLQLVYFFWCNPRGAVASKYLA